MEVIGPDISKYGVIIPNELNSGVAGLVEKPSADKAPSNLACIGRYSLQIFLIYFDACRRV